MKKLISNDEVDKLKLHNDEVSEKKSLREKKRRES